MHTPDFIIAGAPRSGTTWLVHLLDKHPSIFLAKPFVPEPKFFMVDTEYAKGLDYYLERWFSGVEPGQMAGEKTTNYMENPWVAKRIHDHLPQVKLVFILREPADRAYNNYLWSKGNGLETLDFEEALDREEERLATLPEKWRYARPFDYFQRGLYAKHLAPYFQVFGRERILCLKYEDILADPRKLAADLHAFLGVPERPDDALNLGVINAAQGESLDENQLKPDIMAHLRGRYRQANEDLAKLLPDFAVW